jgi:anti-sigma factor (TIGR02949 family)
LPAIPIGEDVTCRDFVDFLSEYFSGELVDAQRTEFEAHLAECPTCVAYLDTYRKTIQLIKTVCAQPEARVPDEVPEQLVNAILAARAADNRSQDSP